MTNIILCDVTASVSELKNDPVATASAGGGYPVAIIDRNRPVFIVCPRLMNKCSMRWTKKTWCN
jgi:antitoxin StbD